mmetsp:Transcript_10520/g.18981  ORF Transcript_10520/g.18981 Transcript_10520/m.18981 type:complete len:423 (-) Transcript_10520:542-1810(-)
MLLVGIEDRGDIDEEDGSKVYTILVAIDDLEDEESEWTQSTVDELVESGEFWRRPLATTNPDLVEKLGDLQRASASYKVVLLMDPKKGHEKPIPNETETYFSEYEAVSVHSVMLRDEHRMDSYRNAIVKNRDSFTDKVVMDVGAGTGILSLLVVQLTKAKLVYSVEASSLGAQLVDIVEANQMNDRIKIIHKKVEDVSLEMDLENEKVDMLISEWMGFYLLHESMLDSVLFARDNLLKPDGAMYPDKAHIYAAPVCLQHALSKSVFFWRTQRPFGFDFSVLEKNAWIEEFKRPRIEQRHPDDILSDATVVASFDLYTLNTNLLGSITKSLRFTMQKSANLHGLALWFDVRFPVNDENVDPIVLSTSPHHVDTTHWFQSTVVIGERAVEKGDQVTLKISLTRSTSSDRNYAILVDADEDSGSD